MARQFTFIINQATNHGIANLSGRWFEAFNSEFQSAAEVEITSVYT